MRRIWPALLACIAMGCHSKSEKPAASTEAANAGLGPEGVRVVVRVVDFLEYSKRKELPSDPNGDWTTLRVVKAPEALDLAEFEVAHVGAAPNDAIWRDVGAEYEITLHRAFLKGALEPPKPDQIHDPRRVRAAGPPEVPRDRSLAQSYACPPGASRFGGPPLPAIKGPGFAGVIIPEAGAAAALHACRNPALEPSAFFTPVADEVALAEAALPQYIREHAVPPRIFLWKQLGRYARQYLGLERHGKHVLYACLVPWEEASGWRCHVIEQCCPGRQPFAVEFDLDQAKVTQMSYNP